MTTRIEELAKQATDDILGVKLLDKDRFARLVARETFDWVVKNVGLMDDVDWIELQQHLGVKA